MDTQPTEIKLLQKQKLLQITFTNGVHYKLPCEYLRVYSPSAEVQGHGGQGGQLVYGKKDVNIIGVDPVGNYAVKLIFDDGHQTGIYSWDYLHELGNNHEQKWQQYLDHLEQAGLSREVLPNNDDID